jgi:AbrB family looped-hinge helix DNA binding protein
MRITTKGQVTIPQEVREKAGLLPGMEVDIVLEGGEVRIVKTKPAPGRPTLGERRVSRLWGAADLGLTADEILRLTRGGDEE